MKRTSFAWMGVAAFATITVSACGKGDAKAATADNSVVVGTENMVVAKTGFVTDGPTLAGSLTAEHDATIRAQVSGSVVSTNVEEGQSVGSGQLLGQLDAAAIQDAYSSAKSAVSSAQTAADIAQRNFTRQQTLLTAGAVAPRDVESAQQGQTSAQSALDDAKSRLATAQKNFENTRLTAPFAGVVSARSVNVGDVVQPGTALFTVVDPSSLRLEASVPAERIGVLSIGMPVTFSINGYPGRTFTGKITRINPVVDPATRQVRIIASLPNTDHSLVVGAFAQGRVSARTHEGLVVSESAVDFREQTPAVLRLKNGKIERVMVQLGMRDTDAETVEITSGVQSGDTLLTGAAQGITPGTPVRVQAPPSDQATQ